jgi:hypothetical protein
MSISVIVSVLVFVLPAPMSTVDPLGLLSTALTQPLRYVLLVLPLGLAALAFLLPLTGVHQRLADEKERLLRVTRDQIRAAGASLREAVERDDLPRMDPLQKALAGLEVEQRTIDAQPTWPWQPETLRWVVGAVMFPVLLYALQLVIARLVIA